MPSQRIKGQEISVLMVRDTVVENELVDVQNLNIEIDLETKREGYLGEKTTRSDDIYNGVKGDLEMHLHSQEYFVFVNAIVSRAKRQTPDSKFNISAVLFFPDGTTPSVIIADVKFGPNPLKVANRGDYVQAKFEFIADDYEVVFG